MPIIGLSETRRIPRIGKLHLGHRHPEKGYPVRDDHFVFNDKISAEIKAEIFKLYGDKPTELDIIIPTEDDEYWCSQYYRQYSASQGLICKGDGKTCTAKIDTDTGTYPNQKTTKFIVHSGMTCTGKDCDYYKSNKCHEVMNLQFLMPKVPGLGIWQVDTGSINSIININSCAQLIRNLFKRVSMIPLKLTLEPKEVNNPESGKKQTVYVLNLRYSGTIMDCVEQAKQLQSQFGVLALPPAPDDETMPDDTPAEPITAEKVAAGEKAAADLFDAPLVKEAVKMGDEVIPEKVVATAKATYQVPLTNGVLKPEGVKPVVESAESAMAFDAMESAAAPAKGTYQLDIPWALSVFQALREKKVEAVMGKNLADRFNANYKVANIPPGAGMKEVLGMLSSAQQFDLAEWLLGLMKEAGIS